MTTTEPTIDNPLLDARDGVVKPTRARTTTPRQTLTISA
jgi:hypothetical protein